MEDYKQQGFIYVAGKYNLSRAFIKKYIRTTDKNIKSTLLDVLLKRQNNLGEEILYMLEEKIKNTYSDKVARVLIRKMYQLIPSFQIITEDFYISNYEKFSKWAHFNRNYNTWYKEENRSATLKVFLKLH